LPPALSADRAVRITLEGRIGEDTQRMSTAASVRAPGAGDRVADILQAACRVVVRDGAHALRMAEVAREAGVSKALLHYYFSTRQELVRAAFAHSSELWDQGVQVRLDRAANGAAKVELYLLASVDSSEPYNEQRALWNEVWSSLRVDSELRPLVQDAYNAWMRRLVSLIEEGRSDGSVPKEVSARRAGRRLAVFADGLDSMLYLSLTDRRKARRLLRESIGRELRVRPR
jgi:AcrR family transcriptional regulator